MWLSCVVDDAPLNWSVAPSDDCFFWAFGGTFGHTWLPNSLAILQYRCRVVIDGVSTAAAVAFNAVPGTVTASPPLTDMANAWHEEEDDVAARATSSSRTPLIIRCLRWILALWLFLLRNIAFCALAFWIGISHFLLLIPSWKWLGSTSPCKQTATSFLCIQRHQNTKYLTRVNNLNNRQQDDRQLPHLRYRRR